MTRTHLITATLLAACAALLLAPQSADARDRCGSHFSWGGDSYFGDRWVYSHYHAFPRRSYRSSRHFIYYRRVPHFYSSIDVYNETYRRSPWYDSYYRFGPYYDAQRYDRDPDRRYPPRLWHPSAPQDDGQRYNREYQPQSSEQPESRAKPQNQQPNFDAPAAQARPVADQSTQQRRDVNQAGRDKLDRAWSLFVDGKSTEAMPMFAEAAMLRSTDAQPRLGYGLAAAATGQDMVASWAIRRALTADPNVMVDLELTDERRDVLAGTFSDYTSIEDGPADQVRDKLVIAATLAVLLGDDAVMKQSLTRLLDMNQRDTVYTLAVATRQTLRARLDGDEPKDFPTEFMASRP